MTLPPGGTYHGYIVTRNPSTGVLANADSAPTVSVERNGASASPTFTTAVTNITTGRYRYAFTVDAGWTAGDTIRVIEAATVDAIAGVTEKALSVDATVSSRSTLTQADVGNELAQRGVTLATMQSIESDAGSAATNATVAATQAYAANAKLSTSRLTKIDGMPDDLEAAIGVTAGGIESIIALFQQGLPEVQPGQQRGVYRINKGDAYGQDHRPLLIVIAKNAQWPENLNDGYEWSLQGAKQEDNEAAGEVVSFAVDVHTATGPARTFSLAADTDATSAFADGAHTFAIVGTKGGNEWRPVKGLMIVEP